MENPLEHTTQIHPSSAFHKRGTSLRLVIGDLKETIILTVDLFPHSN